MDCDFLIVGGGIAGASAGYELAAHGSVVLLEREHVCGYHSTGRSAALFTEAYGNDTIRALARASRAFLEAPPAGFAAHDLLTPRGLLFLGRRDQRDLIDATLALGAGLRELSPEEARRLMPAFDPAQYAFAVHEAAAMDIDVHGLHQGYLAGLKARGGAIVTKAEVRRLDYRRGRWRVVTPAGEFAAPVVVNAAGAWADAVAELAGLAPVGLVAKRRTVITFDPPERSNVSAWAMTLGVAEDWYLKPDAGRVLATPADETPVPPQDVQPEEIDVALAVERIEAATTLRIPRIARKWAGLRTFAADKTPVVGRDPRQDGFFWLAGQGGYGIKTSPALGRATAALLSAGELPDDLRAEGIEERDLSPARFAA